MIQRRRRSDRCRAKSCSCLCRTTCDIGILLGQLSANQDLLVELVVTAIATCQPLRLPRVSQIAAVPNTLVRPAKSSPNQSGTTQSRRENLDYPEPERDRRHLGDHRRYGFRFFREPVLAQILPAAEDTSLARKRCYSPPRRLARTLDPPPMDAGGRERAGPVAPQARRLAADVNAALGQQTFNDLKR